MPRGTTLSPRQSRSISPGGCVSSARSSLQLAPGIFAFFAWQCQVGHCDDAEEEGKGRTATRLPDTEDLAKEGRGAAASQTTL